MASDDPWVGLNEAARLRGSGRLGVALEAADGDIRCKKVGGVRFFHREDIEKLRAAAAPVAEADAEVVEVDAKAAT